MNFFIKTSSNLYLFWNIGSILMMLMFIQIMIGFIISMSYFYYSNNMFINSFFIYYNLNYGWMIRFMHSNLTSMIFITMFIHLTRSLIYKNYMNKKMWLTGMSMILILMLISFIGYSLVWTQMAYWAMMVITNFISTIPLMGKTIMLMIWGNKFINNILLNRFFSIHFIMAIIVMILSLMHLIILHNKKSTNPININNNFDEININPTFIYKDYLMFMMMIYIMMMINLIIPMKMNNPDNFNSMLMFKTPSHIEPEWYFLFFYSILRSVNDKFTGLMIMIMSIIIWLIMPMINKTKFITNKFNYLNKLMIMLMIFNMCLITFMGSKPSKFPYIKIIKMLIFLYFIQFWNMYFYSKLFNLM